VLLGACGQLIEPRGNRKHLLACLVVMIAGGLRVVRGASVSPLETACGKGAKPARRSAQSVRIVGKHR